MQQKGPFYKGQGKEVGAEFQINPRALVQGLILEDILHERGLGDMNVQKEGSKTITNEQSIVKPLTETLPRLKGIPGDAVT